jgi:GNAT superfamily N-acetyltransferase
LKEIEIIRYEEPLEDGVVELWQEAFGGEAPAQRSYFRWKYHENPYIPEPTLFLAVDRRNRVVGTRGFSGTRWYTAAGTVLVPCAEDFAIANRYQGSGVAAEIMRFALDDMTQRGFEYVMNTSGGEITVLQSIAMGWRSVGAMEPAARLSWRRRLRRALPTKVRHRRVRAVSFTRFDGATRSVRLEGGSTIVAASTPRPDAMADLVGRLPLGARIRHVRDREFFEWRYRKPGTKYRFLFNECDDRLDGFLAIAAGQTLGEPMFHLADWEGSTPEIRAELLRLALRAIRPVAIDAWTASLEAGDEALLERLDFRPSQHERRARGLPCVLLKKLVSGDDWSIAGTPALETSNWDIRLIDTMRT